MRFAVISDVHGNLDALAAVLADIKHRAIEQVYCAGDLVGYGPHPNEVIELIRREAIPTVMGNYDDAVANDRPVCGCAFPDARARELGEQSLAWTKERVTAENKLFLRGLPLELSFRAGPYKVLLVHGSPRFLDEYLYEDAPAELLQEIFVARPVDVLIVGHTHKAYHRKLYDRHIIGAGSVGRPVNGCPNPVYTLVRINQVVAVTFVRVAYDPTRTAKAIEASGLPPEFARQLLAGQE